jgi:hypothetical protein
VTKREFTIDTDDQKVDVEGHTHKNVALKYLMKRRRSLLMTKDPDKVESLYYNLPQHLKVMGKHKTHIYAINWDPLTFRGRGLYLYSKKIATSDAHDVRFS